MSVFRHSEDGRVYTEKEELADYSDYEKHEESGKNLTDTRDNKIEFSQLESVNVFFKTFLLR